MNDRRGRIMYAIIMALVEARRRSVIPIGSALRQASMVESMISRRSGFGRSDSGLSNFVSQRILSAVRSDL